MGGGKAPGSGLYLAEEKGTERARAASKAPGASQKPSKLADPGGWIGTRARKTGQIGGFYGC